MKYSGKITYSYAAKCRRTRFLSCRRAPQVSAPGPSRICEFVEAPTPMLHLLHYAEVKRFADVDEHAERSRNPRWRRKTKGTHPDPPNRHAVMRGDKCGGAVLPNPELSSYGHFRNIVFEQLRNLLSYGGQAIDCSRGHVCQFEGKPQLARQKQGDAEGYQSAQQIRKQNRKQGAPRDGRGAPGQSGPIRSMRENGTASLLTLGKRRFPARHCPELVGFPKNGSPGTARRRPFY